MENLICAIANLFRMYIIYRFIGVFFVKKRSPGILMLTFGVYYMINTALYLGFHLAWVNIINSYAGVVIIVLLHTKSVKKIIEISSIIYILNMVCDIVATVPFREYIDGANTSGQILFILCDFLYLMCELIVERIMKVRDEGQQIPLVVVPFISVGILMYMLYSGEVLGIPVVVVSVGLLFINFLVIYLYNALLSSVNKIHENEILSEKIEMYNNQINIISKNEEQVLAIRHDMKNHLNELKIMAINEKYNEIQAYIDNMTKYISNPDEIVKTGNIEMDSLINYLIKKGKEQLHEVDIKIDMPKDINTFDINVVIGNLLDNAIEAASETDEKILKGSIILEQGVLRIQLRNSYNRNNESEKNQKSSGRGKVHHSGIGLNNVQKIVEKYNGLMVINLGEYYETKVLLYVSD